MKMKGKKIFNGINFLLFLFALWIFLEWVSVFFIWEGRRLPIHSGVDLAFIKNGEMYCYLSEEGRVKGVYRAWGEDMPDSFMEFELKWLLLGKKLLYIGGGVNVFQCFVREGKVKEVKVIDCKSKEVEDIFDLIGREDWEMVRDIDGIKRDFKKWEFYSHMNIGERYNYFCYGDFKGKGDRDGREDRYNRDKEIVLVIERRGGGGIKFLRHILNYEYDISRNEKYVVYSSTPLDGEGDGRIFLYDIERGRSIYLTEGRDPRFYRNYYQIIYRYREGKKVILKIYDTKKKECWNLVNRRINRVFEADSYGFEVVPDTGCLYLVERCGLFFNELCFSEINIEEWKYRHIFVCSGSFAVCGGD